MLKGKSELKMLASKYSEIANVYKFRGDIDSFNFWRKESLNILDMVRKMNKRISSRKK